MKKLIRAIIALKVIGVAVVRPKIDKKVISSIIVTNNDNELLVDLTEGNIVFHDDVKVYLNGELVD